MSNTPNKSPVPRLPKTFVPDFGGQPVSQRHWVTRIPIVRWCAAASGIAIGVAAICGFVWGAINQFNH